MSTADQNLQNAVIRTYTVKAASTATRGLGGVFDSEGVVLDAVAGDNVSVVFLETKAAGEKVQCVVLTGGCIVPVKVSVAGATAGKFAIAGTDGFEDKTLGGGTTVRYLAGYFTETGVDNDFVGMAVGKFAGVSS